MNNLTLIWNWNHIKNNGPNRKQLMLVEVAADFSEIIPLGFQESAIAEQFLIAI